VGVDRCGRCSHLGSNLEPGMKYLLHNLSLAFHRLQVVAAIATAKKAAALDNNPHPMVALAIAHWDMRSRTATTCLSSGANLDSRYRDRASRS